jgi:CheY-like chemotaxis protein
MNAVEFNPVSPTAGAVPTILVVEDDILIRLVTSDYLRDNGFVVIEASNADEAVRLLKASEVIDLVFSDINMPGEMDGFGLADWIAQNQPHLKVMLTSGVARHDPATGPASQAPLLPKPYRQEELIRRLRVMLAG